jgi:two-component system, OmpR family, sensor kinase
MKIAASLQARLALAIGLSITLLWLAAAAVTATRVSGDMEEVYDDGLKATAERILPIARHDLAESRKKKQHEDGDHDEEDDIRDKRPGREARYGEDVTFILRDSAGQILNASQGADPRIFPPYQASGFVTTDTHRLYYDATPDKSLTIAVAEPLEQRSALSRKMLLGLLLPLLVVIPLSLLAIPFVVRQTLRPVRSLQRGLARRGAQDLSPLPDIALPSELRPISAGINKLLERLRAAFAAERAFAANAAHELRTPVAGAIAQAQRIRSETKEPQTAHRASEIEATLKRLMRMSEKLMQLARAEGGRLRADEPSDVRPIVRMIVEDFQRAGEGRIALVLSDGPVMTMLDPDAVGILVRNLIENALKHGAQDSDVDVSVSADMVLSVANDGPAISPEATERLMHRFERGNGRIDGSGLGLAIVNAVVDRAGAGMEIRSPRTGRQEGVEVLVRLPAG